MDEFVDDVVDLFLPIFGQITEKRKNQLRARHRNEVARDAEKAENDANERESELRRKYDADLETYKRWHQEAIQDAEEEESKKSEQKTKECLESRKQNSETLRRTENKLKEIYSLEIDKLKKEQKMEHESYKQMLETNQKKLDSRKKMLADENNQLNKILKNGIEEGAKLEKMHEANQAKATKNHQETIMELMREHTDREIEKEKEKLELEENQKKQHDQYLKQSQELEEDRLMSSQQLMEAVSSEKKHEEFWNKCLNIITLFNKFKSFFNNEETAILKVIKEMKLGNELTILPQLRLVTKCLQNLLDELQQLLLSTDQEIRELRDKTLEKTENLKKKVTLIAPKIVVYEREHKSGNGKILRKIAEDVISLHTLARELIKELSELIIEFNIPEPKLFAETLRLQSELLSGNLRITNGASKSAKLDEIAWKANNNQNQN